MAVDISTFRTRFPEFIDPPFTDARVQLALDDATLCMDETRWGKFYEIAANYLAAHILVIKQRQLVDFDADTGEAYDGAPDASQTADKVSWSKAIVAIDTAEGQALLASTSYGLTYLELAKKVRPVGFMVIGGV